MRTVIKPFYQRNIDENNPFANDYFQRKLFAQNLRNLFFNSDDGLVITINSKWGDGKTTFIKLWEIDLKKDENFIPIYYDAFKNDFAGDAFLSIASLIQNALKEKIESESGSLEQKKQLEYLKKTAKKVAVDLVKMGTGFALSSLTGGIVNKQGVNFIEKWFRRLIFGTLEFDMDEQFDSYIKSMESVNQYQEALKEIITSKKKNRKIVFFVDELDRCRPDFAVEVIEKIKHLFEIENVNFVLAINRGQLVQTISSVYGVSGDDGIQYLQKFVHVETQLPGMGGISDEDRQERIKEYINDVLDAYGFEETIMSKSLICDSLAELSNSNILNLNQRSIERIVTLISIALSSCNINKANRLAKNFVFLAALKIGAPEIYDETKNGAINNKHTSIYRWVEEYYDSTEIAKRNGTLLDIHYIKEAHRILDIYELPPSFDKESN